MGDAILFHSVAGRLPHEVSRRAAHARAKSELFQPFRVGDLAKALTPDDSYDVPDGDRGIKRDPACPVCGRIMNPGAMVRHKVASGHGTEKARPENAEIARSVIDKSASRRFTQIAVPPGEVGLTAPDAARKRIWKFADEDPTISLEGRTIGQVVEWGCLPFDSDVKKARLPTDTMVLGIRWTPSGWRDVAAGRISPAAVARAILA